MIKKKQPDSSAVFNLPDGEQIRIEFDRIYIYKSSNKTNETIIELGWAPDTETIVIDSKFEDFDRIVQENKRAWKEYWSEDRSIY